MWIIPPNVIIGPTTMVPGINESEIPTKIATSPRKVLTFVLLVKRFSIGPGLSGCKTIGTSANKAVGFTLEKIWA